VDVLLDTHFAIWAITDPAQLKGVGELIEDEANRVVVSTVSVWEIAIKIAIGKRSAPTVSGWEALREFEAIGFDILPVTGEHAATVADLPLIHHDPFDRLLIAQAATESLVFITRDKLLARYGGDIRLA
jgi:PIN domain nuclease of toxin-antitoxin system